MKHWLETFPITNALRVGAFALIVVALAVDAATTWELTWPWATLLGALAGVSVAGHVGKRATYRPEVSR